MRVLFVDDEARILTGIENALLFDYDGWDVEFASSGGSAIDHLNQQPFDVLVTDMQMPGLTGADVLEHAKNQHPDTLRIVLSGQVNEELAQRAMPLTHEFVSKPCPPDKLFSVIERVFDSSRSLTTASGVGVLSILHQLPAQAALQIRVQDAFDNQAPTTVIARIIEEDLSITASIIRTANSSFYGGHRPVKEVGDAVSRLGSKTLNGLLLNAELSAWTTPQVTDLVAKLNHRAARRSALVGVLVKQDHGYASQASLLCDIGILALVALFPERTEDLEESLANGAGSADRERVLFGATHAAIGAAMLGMWNFAPTVVEAVRFHHQFLQADGPGRNISEMIAAADFVCSTAEGCTPLLPEGLADNVLAEATALLEKVGTE